MSNLTRYISDPQSQIQVMHTCVPHFLVAATPRIPNYDRFAIARQDAGTSFEAEELAHTTMRLLQHVRATQLFGNQFPVISASM